MLTDLAIVPIKMILNVYEINLQFTSHDATDHMRKKGQKMWRIYWHKLLRIYVLCFAGRYVDNDLCIQLSLLMSSKSYNALIIASS